ncbi:hypothetical protein ACXYMU_19765 [Pontibacter sp. CAU 1760]
MNRIVLPLLVFIFCLTSCSQQKEEEVWPHELYWQAVRGTHQEIYYLPLTIEQKTNNSTSTTTYRTLFDTTTYFINIKKPEIAAINSTYEDQKLFNFVENHSIPVNGKEMEVYQFSTADGSIDFGSEHYWSEQLGFFFVRGTSWSNYRVLQYSDVEKNKEVWQIVKALHPRIKDNLRLAGSTEGMEHLRQKQFRTIE